MKPWKLGLIGDVTALGLSIFTPILLVMWFWAFGYISLWIYRFTLPALAILGISWFTEATGWRNKRASTLGNILLWLELGIGILWFRAAIDDWSIFLIAALSFLVWLIGRYAGRFIADWT